MSKTLKFIVKERANRSSLWVVKGTWATLELAVDNCPRRTGTPDLETAVFHQGRIEKWYRGGKDITKNSRQVPTSSGPADSPDVHWLFHWLGAKGLLPAAACIARDEHTARRLVENAVCLWDFSKLKMEMVKEVPGPTCLVALRPELATIQSE